MHIHKHGHKGKWASRPTENSFSEEKKNTQKSKPVFTQELLRKVRHSQNANMGVQPAAGGRWPPPRCAFKEGVGRGWGAGEGSLQVTYLPQLQ